MAFWLVKSEPSAYSWEDFIRQGKAVWDGVRNYQARNNLVAMQMNDQVLFYHSIEGKEIVGVARVSREAYPDPTSLNDPRWVVVELQPLMALEKSVTLQQLKIEPLLQNVALLRQSRLSVMPIRPDEFECIMSLGFNRP